MLFALGSPLIFAADPALVTGQLWRSNDGRFVLASGDLIALVPAHSLDLAAYVGRKVTVTGEWSSDRKSLRVLRIESVHSP